MFRKQRDCKEIGCSKRRFSTSNKRNFKKGKVIGQTRKNDQNEEKVEEKQDSSSKTPAKKTASRSRSKTPKSKKAIDTSELNEKA